MPAPKSAPQSHFAAPDFRASMKPSTLVALSADNAAADGYITNLAVSACAVTGGDPFYDWSGIYNTHTGSIMYTDCSLPSSVDVANSDMIVVWVNDLSTSAAVTCSMRIMDGSGGTILTRAAQSSSGTGQRAFRWDSLEGLNGEPYVSCKVPAAGSSSLATQSGVNGIYNFQGVGS